MFRLMKISRSTIFSLSSTRFSSINKRKLNVDEVFSEKSKDELRPLTNSDWIDLFHRLSFTQTNVQTLHSTNPVEDLLQIFERNVQTNQFVDELKRMNELIVTEMNPQLIYPHTDPFRQRIESILLNSLGKFSDSDLLIVFQFLKKFYVEDNEFTRQISPSLIDRLKSFSVQQIVRLFEQFENHRGKNEWIQRISQCLLKLVENRYLELENIEEILSISSKCSLNDRLIDLFDERILQISDHLTSDDWLRILIQKSTLKRRDRTIIRAACYHLFKQSESSLFSLEKIKDCLYVCAKLNLHDRSFLERLTRNIFEQIHQIDDLNTLTSLVTSMGTLRLRHCELLNSIGKFLMKKKNSSTAIFSFIRCCASVFYFPPNLSKLIEENCQNLSKLEIKTRLDLLWSLAILDQANENHFHAVFNDEVFQFVQNEIRNSKIGQALKLLSLYSYGLQRFPMTLNKPTFLLEEILPKMTLKNSEAQNQLIKTIVEFAPENQFCKFNVFTSNLIVIDCLMIVDRMGNPQDLTSTFSDQQRLTNKIHLDENSFKIALKFLDYQEKTLLSPSISGSVAFQMKLLNSLGYISVPIHYDEFVKIQSADDRRKFLQRSIRSVVCRTNKKEFF